MIPIARVDVTPAVGMPYKDVDVTAFVDPTNTAGVMLEIINTSAATAYDWGVRNNGSIDNHEDQLYKAGHTWVAIGVDATDIFEAYIQNAFVKIYLVGYITTVEGGFLTNAVDKTPARNSVWNDIDISVQTGADTALCAFFLLKGNLGNQYGLRKNGSTDDRRNQIYLATALQGGMMSVDGSEILEGRIDGGTTVAFWLVGWLTDNMLDWANAKDYQSGVASAWVEVDFSPDIPAGWDGAFCHFHPSVISYRSCGIRVLGSAFNNYYRSFHHIYLWTQIDGARKAQQRIENTDMDLWLWGYTRQPPVNTAPTAPTGLEVNGQSTPTGSNCTTELTPGFSAIYNDPDAGDQANAINIQVGTAAGFSDMWDSGWLADATIEGNRCTAKTYAGAALSTGTSYWWRCRFRDDDNDVGAWSAWQQFDICWVAPNAPLNLLCKDLVNPRNVRPHIYFSAVFDDSQPTQMGAHCQIQISLREAFDDLIWDSGRMAIANINIGIRSENIFYSGPVLPLDRSRYHWRLRFWNAAGLAGPWSS